MGQVLIRNLDDEVLQDYREAARNAGRSLEAELRDLLMKMRPRSPQRVAELRDRVRIIREMTPDVPQTPGWELIREDRDGDRGA